jgi:tetratricopeptide (TPR) repeat protein
VERALELARQVTYPYPRALAEAQIAPALARAGDIEGALRLARDIGKQDAGVFGDSIRAEIPAALAEIARIQARSGDRDGARKTLREAWALARTVSDRGVVLFERTRRIADAAAEIVDVEAARMAADEIDDDALEKVLALVALARAQLKVGDTKAARATLDDAVARAGAVGPQRNVINDNPAANRERALREIALALAEAGDAKKALGLDAARGSDSWKAEVRAAIAPIQARLGDIPDALATARSVTEPGRAGEAYTEIAAIQARTSGAEPVLAWAKELEPPAARAFALIGLAEGLGTRRKEGGATGRRQP